MRWPYKEWATQLNFTNKVHVGYLIFVSSCLLLSIISVFWNQGFKLFKFDVYYLLVSKSHRAIDVSLWLLSATEKVNHFDFRKRDAMHALWLYGTTMTEFVYDKRVVPEFYSFTTLALWLEFACYMRHYTNENDESWLTASRTLGIRDFEFVYMERVLEVVVIRRVWACSLTANRSEDLWWKL